MPPATEPNLANLLGYATGTIVFGIFVALLVKDRAGRRQRTGLVTLASAAMALMWNAGALALMAVDSFALLVVTTSAMSLLPALLLDLILDGRRRAVTWAGYALSAASVALHASEPLFSGAELHRRTLQGTAVGFALLSAAAMAGWGRQRRAWAAMALFLFALSFAHLHNEGDAHAWAVELVVHHAGIPLALFVLMQDYRFLLLDAFLRFLTNILLAAVATWGAAEAAFRLGWVDYQKLPAGRVALMAIGSCGILVGFALARAGAQHLLTRLVLRRGDAEALVAELRKAPVESEAGYVEWAGGRVAKFFEAERGEGGELAFELGRRAGGRPYLSEDLQLLARMEAAVGERVEQYREAELKRLVAQAELRALQAQIHPHFLFNALNALYGSIPKEAAAARRTVLNLSDIFRYFLRDDRSTIPLEREMEIVRAYLEIEALRLGERLKVEMSIDEAARGVEIPVLSIQPLVENAVRHGVTAAGSGTVRVEAAVEGGRLRVRVRDSGAGFVGGWGPLAGARGLEGEAEGGTGVGWGPLAGAQGLEGGEGGMAVGCGPLAGARGLEGRTEGAGMGLDNVRQRLRLCFGEEARLEVGREGGETVVGFEVPGATS